MFYFSETYLQAINIKMTRNKSFEYLAVSVINLSNKKVSISQTTDKKILNFFTIFSFLPDVPVLYEEEEEEGEGFLYFTLYLTF